MTKFRLISFALCPYVQRAAILLAEKGVEFERANIDLDDKPDWFLKLSPLGKVPVLVVEQDGHETTLFESAVIAEYLDETLEPRLHPADPLEKARHRAWIEFASATLADIYGLETAADAASFESRSQALEAKFERLEGVLGEGPWFAGARFTIVDAAFAPAFRYFDLFDEIAGGRFFDGKPKLRAWRSSLAERQECSCAGLYRGAQGFHQAQGTLSRTANGAGIGCLSPANRNHLQPVTRTCFRRNDEERNTER